MEKTKKSFKFLGFILILLISLCSFGCSNDEKVKILKIYNWQDYIDEGLDDDGNVVGNAVIDDWIESYEDRHPGVTVEVVYNTFETCEYMMNILRTGSEQYDLICPSDYVIQKMIADDMLEPYDYNIDDGYQYINNYNDYGSKYVKKIFENTIITNNEKEQDFSFAQYAVPYMWGTMGFVYRAEDVALEDVSSWSILWNENYKGKATIKNAVHDTYVVGALYVYQNELINARDEYEASSKTQADKDKYNNIITNIMNSFDKESVDKVGEQLLSMRDNIYGFEVDNGKTDIASGRITINFAWSGDAVYSMDVAEEEGLQLNYAVPEEGSNLFFDGWVMPKGADTDLAQDFINFICDPEIASRNMNTIGYTSVIAGDAIWSLVNDWYNPVWDDPLALESDDEEDEEDEESIEYTDEDLDIVDLTYFFEGTLSEEYLDPTTKKALIKVDKEERGRQFDAQYPTEEVILRCAIMKDFGAQNQYILDMWEMVRCGDASPWIWIGTAIVVSVCAIFIIYQSTSKSIRKNRRKKNEIK